MKLALAVLVVWVATATAQPGRPGPDAPVDAATRAQVIDGAIAQLRKSYVFPDVAAKIDTMLRDRVKAGAYDRITSSTAFAAQLTKDLQSVSHDGHMRMRYSAEPVPPEGDPDAPPSAEELARLDEWVRDVNGGIVKVERLDGNVGYLRLDYLLPGDAVGAKLAAAMTLLADTDVLILDLRNNHGGEPGTVAVVVSYLYAAFEEHHINDIYMRPTNSTREYWTVQSLPGPRFAAKPVYVLTSHDTFSGGEELSYDLKNLKRATLIGEVTGGGANPGGRVRVAEHFALFVPSGRAVSPITKTNWEGVGVKPDVAVPAAKALDVAYLEALRAQRKRVSAKDALSSEIDDALATATPKAAAPKAQPAAPTKR